MAHFTTLQIAGMSDTELNIRIDVAIGNIGIDIDAGALTSDWDWWNALPLQYRRIRRLIDGDPPGPYAPGVYCADYCNDADWSAWAAKTSGTITTGTPSLRSTAEAVFHTLDIALSGT